MKSLDEKLALLREKMQGPDAEIGIMIVGLGSVGLYLLDYLVSLADPRLHVVVAGRNLEKMRNDVNIVRTAATIRGQFRCRVDIDAECDLERPESVAAVIARWSPDFIVNSSRVYSGLKYGTISWHKLRAYGIWTPLSGRYARNIMEAYEAAGSAAITINTSYSDAVIPWLKSAGMAHFDFGSGNLNHLIPRMKFHIAEKFGIADLNDIDVTMAVSHFHDVVVSKEGHDEGVNFPLSIRHAGKELNFDRAKLLKACVISMPTDQKRNMMNASSNFDIIRSILRALDGHRAVKFHSPGVCGEIGGYPFIVDATDGVRGYVDESVFSLEQMRRANRESIYLDGIADVSGGRLYYTPELQQKVEKVFGKTLPEIVSIDEIDNFGTNFLIRQIIEESDKGA